MQEARHGLPVPFDGVGGVPGSECYGGGVRQPSQVSSSPGDNTSGGRKRTRSTSADDLECKSPPQPRHPPKRRLAIVPRSLEHICATQIGVEMVLDSITLGKKEGNVFRNDPLPPEAENVHTVDDNVDDCEDLVHKEPPADADDDDSDSDDD